MGGAYVCTGMASPSPALWTAFVRSSSPSEGAGGEGRGGREGNQHLEWCHLISDDGHLEPSVKTGANSLREHMQLCPVEAQLQLLCSLCRLRPPPTPSLSFSSSASCPRQSHTRRGSPGLPQVTHRPHTSHCSRDSPAAPASCLASANLWGAWQMKVVGLSACMHTRVLVAPSGLWLNRIGQSLPWIANTEYYLPHGVTPTRSPSASLRDIPAMRELLFVTTPPSIVWISPEEVDVTVTSAWGTTAGNRPSCHMLRHDPQYEI